MTTPLQDNYLTLSQIAPILDMTCKQLAHYARHPSFPAAAKDTYPRRFKLTDVMRWFENKPAILDWKNIKKPNKNTEDDGLMTARELAAALNMNPRNFEYHTQKPDFPVVKTTVRPRKYDKNEVKAWFKLNFGKISWYGQTETEREALTVDALADLLDMDRHLVDRYAQEKGFPAPKKRRIPRRYDVNEVRDWFRKRKVGPYGNRRRNREHTDTTNQSNNPTLQIQFLTGHYDPPGKRRGHHRSTRNIPKTTVVRLRFAHI